MAELNFTTVRAPFDGMVDRLPRQQGSFVQKGETLTTLSDNSLMWVYFNVPEARYLEYMADLDQHKDDLKIELVLANGNKFHQPGKLGAIGADFNNGTETFAFRADFPNPDRLLRHGQTGTVLISQVQNDAIVIPQRATFEVLDKRYVYVVDKDDVAHQREIVIQNELEDRFVIKKGVDVDDKIVVEGVRLVHDGDKVEYEDRQPIPEHPDVSAQSATRGSVSLEAVRCGIARSPVTRPDVPTRVPHRSPSLLPALALSRAAHGAMAGDAATAPRHDRLFFTSQGKTALVNADGSGLRYLEFDKPGQATWQPGGIFPMADASFF